jgi:rhodanese-related sulfurtransferase
MLSHAVPVLDVDSVQQHPTKYILLDAREWDEYTVSHIPGARYIGYKQFSERALRGVTRESPIAVYCSVGYRSEKIAERLRGMGYTQVYNVYGSIFEWANRGYPLAAPGGGEVRRVHTYNRKWSRWVLNGNIEKVW